MTLAGKILVVDDHLDLAENVAEILEGAGFEAVVAASAEAALARVEEGDVAAVITDYRMPGRSGAELILELRRRGYTVPALVMSAFTDDATVAAASRAGAVEVLAKPLDLRRLLAMVEQLDAGETIILVVEDNHALAENLAEALAGAGFRANVTGTVAEALAARPLPRAAIVDFALPDGTGVEVARHLQARDPRVELLFVSAHGDKLDPYLEGALAGAERLHKPFPIERLLEWVNQAMAHGRQPARPGR